MAGSGRLGRKDAAPEIGNTNGFAILESPKRKKKKKSSDSSKGKGSSSKDGISQKEEVFWKPKPISNKSWADDEDDDDYYATTAPLQSIWGAPEKSSQKKEMDMNAVIEEEEETDSLAEKMLEEEHSKESGSLHEEEEEDDIIVSDDVEGLRKKVGKNKRKRKDEANAVEGKRGVCYLSRVPPRMEPLNLRRILSRFGDIQRIYLTPEDPTVQVQRKQAGGFRGKKFSEGWVEFTKKSVAKKVANMLNGEQMGGKRRSSFFYDTWNIKYLSNFKWDDLTSELANKNRTREQKLALELSAAKRERDFYLRKVDQSRALNAMQERKKKTQKAHGPPSGGTDVEEPKVIRKFPQNRPVDRITVESKSRLSKDFLSGVFGGS